MRLGQGGEFLVHIHLPDIFFLSFGNTEGTWNGLGCQGKELQNIGRLPSLEYYHM